MQGKALPTTCTLVLFHCIDAIRVITLCVQEAHGEGVLMLVDWLEVRKP